jgi:hypothetical protein
MRRVLLAFPLSGISTKRHTKEIASQWHKNICRHIRRLFILPRANVIRRYLLFATTSKRNGRHMPTALCYSYGHRLVCQEKARLIMNHSVFFHSRIPELKKTR